MNQDNWRCFLCSNSSSRIAGASLLGNNLNVIFILRNLLKMPRILLGHQLKECGDNPEDWMSLCDECTTLTDKAKELYHEIKKIEKQILKKITSDEVTDDDEEADNETYHCGNSLFQKKIRLFVKQNNHYRQWENEDDDCGGFLEGDKLANQLASQQNSNSTAQILMVENDVDLDIEGIKEEVDSLSSPVSPSSPAAMSPSSPQEVPVSISSSDASENDDDSDDYEEEEDDDDEEKDDEEDQSFSIKMTRKSKPDVGVAGTSVKNQMTSGPTVTTSKIQKYDLCICNCPHCGKQFTSQISLELHIKKIHLQPKTLTTYCPVCSKGFAGDGPKHLHMLNVHKDDPITSKVQKETGISLHKCPLCCKALYLTKEHLNKHFERFHFGVDMEKIIEGKVGRVTEDGKFECGKCGRIFQFPKYWSEHLWKKHDLEGVPCPVEGCGVVVVEKGGNEFQDHWNGVHKKKKEKERKEVDRKKDDGKEEEDEGPWICEICGVEKYSRKSWYGHRRAVHKIGVKGEVGNKVQLLVNGKLVEIKGKEKKRYKKKEEEPVVCNLCGKVFKSGGGLSHHLKFVHEKMFNLSCHVCGYGAVSRECLNRHLLTKHEEDPVSGRLREEEGLGVWRCGVVGCSKIYLRKEGLEKHGERVHGGEGGLKCGVCGKEFWISSKLREHEDTHDKGKERRWKCEICGNGFGVKNNLRCHMIKVHKVWKSKIKNLE